MSKYKDSLDYVMEGLTEGLAFFFFVTLVLDYLFYNGRNKTLFIKKITRYFLFFSFFLLLGSLLQGINGPL